jgi:Leucine-rich repeat (LRR) protein
VFRKQEQLETLILSQNLLQSFESRIFGDCKYLRNFSLSENSISEISSSAFDGLEHLEQLDLSNNDIEKLDTLIFEAFSISTNRQNHQVSSLKPHNLAQKKVQFFNFEIYFPMKRNSDSSDPTFQLDYLNVSSNRLTTLDVASNKPNKKSYRPHSKSMEF